MIAYVCVYVCVHVCVHVCVCMSVCVCVVRENIELVINTLIPNSKMIKLTKFSLIVSDHESL